MKTIIPQNVLFDKIIGKQVIEKSKKYRPLIFTVIANEQVPIIYNLVTLELLELTNQEVKLFDNEIPYSKELDVFIEKWFLVPNDFNDAVFYKQFISIADKLKKKDAIYNYTIMTTTDCNARCFYCYEKGTKKVAMNEDTAHQLVKYIKNHSKDNKIKICWFGGEPLFNRKAIDIISEELINEKLNFNSLMITNGYLFDDETINTAITKWKLKIVQITLDGTEEIYNKTKNYIYEANINYFERICNNIEKLLISGIGVVIRINIGVHNITDIDSLSDYLIKRYKDYKKLRIYIVPLFDFTNKRTSTEKQNLINEIIRIESKLYEHNLVRAYLPRKLTVNRCMADDDASTLVTPDGKLGMCEHFSESEIWGDIFKEDLINEDIKKSWYISYDHFSECSTCKLMPVCKMINKCPEASNICDEISRNLKFYRLKRAIINEWKQNGKLDIFANEETAKINLL